MSRNAGLFRKIKTFHIFDILCWFSIMFSCCMCCILEQCLNSNINNSIKFTFFHLKCPIFIICDVAWGMTPCVTCLRVKDDGCTRWFYTRMDTIWTYGQSISLSWMIDEELHCWQHGHPLWEFAYSKRLNHSLHCT
jgi:hypothetical protein